MPGCLIQRASGPAVVIGLLSGHPDLLQPRRHRRDGRLPWLRLLGMVVIARESPASTASKQRAGPSMVASTGVTRAAPSWRSVRWPAGPRIDLLAARAFVPAAADQATAQGLATLPQALAGYAFLELAGAAAATFDAAGAPGVLRPG